MACPLGRNPAPEDPIHPRASPWSSGAWIKTRDGITLEGIYAKPRRKSKTALIWLHGLSSRFSSGQTLIKELSYGCSRLGIGYFKFNNRGHDIVNRDGPNREKFQGAGFEKFEKCVLDIRAMIRLAQSLGFKKIVLAGHSTGANKVLYYIYKTRDRRVKGLILAGPLSDIAAGYGYWGKKALRQGVKIAETLKKKNPSLLMPQSYGIYTASRYLSLYKPGMSEDVFSYHNPQARWRELKIVKIPVAVIVGSRDEYLDRTPKKFMEAFQKNAISTKLFSGIIIKGARHGFQKKEKELTRAIVGWLKRGMV